LIQDFDKNAIMYQQIPASSKKWIPESFQSAVVCEGLDPMDEIIQHSTEDLDACETLNTSHFQQRIHNKIPSLFITLFRIINEELYKVRQLNFPHFSYEILKFISARYMITCTSSLVDFILFTQKQAGNAENVINQLCRSVNDFIFKYEFLTLDRFLFQLVIHPNDDESIQNSLIFLKHFTTDNVNIDQRFKFLIEFLPSFQHMPFCNSSKFFNGIQEYYKKFPEHSYSEMSNKDKDGDCILESEHLPIYYSNLMEQLLPIVEFLFQRLIEQETPPEIFVPLMKKFSCVFKYHPQPAIYLYRTLYSFPPHLIRHDWIRECVRHIALLDRDHKLVYKYSMLSENFMDRFDVASPVEICSLLIERINKATTYKHQPPNFCSKDWRFAELPPAAATLVGANIELMISKYAPDVLIDALLQCGFKKPQEKPFEIINAIGLILTTLPESFQKNFIEKCENFINLEELINQDKPEMLLESYLVDGYLGTDNDPVTAIAIIHSFTQHCSNGGLTLISQLIENMHSKITTESQLLFMMRIIVPILHRVPDQTKLSFIVFICQSITVVSQKKEKLNFEDTYCDLIYQMKYTVLGFMGMEKLESLILQFPLSLREKMKYFYSSKEEHDTAMAKQKEKILQQQLSQQQMLQKSQMYQNNFPENSKILKHGLSNIRIPVNPGNDPKEKIESEMVAPPVRADTLPEMTYQPTLIRPPEMPMGPTRPQGVRAPGMMPNIGNMSSMGNMNNMNNMPNMPPMSSQTTAPGMTQMNMNPMVRMSQMGPQGGQMSSMMPPNFVPSTPPNMNPQHPGFMPNQPPMYMPPGTSGGQMPPNAPDGMMSSGPPPFNMMNPGFPNNPMSQGNPMPPGGQIPMGIPNQAGVMGPNNMMNQGPGNMMNQGGMGPPHMMPGGQQGYGYNQGMRQPMPPYQPGMLPPR